MDSNTESKITENTSLVEKVFTFQNVYHAHPVQRKKYNFIGTEVFNCSSQG